MSEHANAPDAKNIAVLGAGVAGLATALALSRAGHRVTIFERDCVTQANTPEEAFEQDRRGAPQIRHSHTFLARLRNILRDDFPDVLGQLYEAGATDHCLDRLLPRDLAGSPFEAGDENLTMLACRRSTFDWVLQRAVEAEPRVVLRDQVEIAGLTGTPMRVTGVSLLDGTVESFDLVVAANGRRCPLAQWLTELGAPTAPEVHADSGLVYFTRFYRLTYGSEAPPHRGGLIRDLGFLKYGVFPGDNGTFSISIASPKDDTELRRLLDDEVRFDAAARTFSLTAAHLDGRAEPISSVTKITGLVNRWQNFVSDGRPLAVGIFPVGDALLTTNPLYGRGCATAFWCAQLLAGALAAHPGDLAAAALAYDAAAQAELRPWVTATIREDTEARQMMRAILGDPDDVQDTRGDEAEPETGQRTGAADRARLRAALRTDMYVFRAVARILNLIIPAEALETDPELRARIASAPLNEPNEPTVAQIRSERAALIKRLSHLRSNAAPVRPPILAAGSAADI